MQSFKLNKNTEIPFNTLVDNIRKVFIDASPEIVTSGSNWYNVANRFARIISDETKTPLFVVCMVIAALSPRNPWYDTVYVGNLGAALRMIESFNKCDNPAGYDGTHVSCSTFNSNRVKAWAILLDNSMGHNDAEYYHVKHFGTATKTWNFCNNIFNPDSTDYVTIDGHATHIALYGLNYVTLKNAPSIKSGNKYQVLVNAYRAVAAEFNVKAWQIQAVTWENYRLQSN